MNRFGFGDTTVTVPPSQVTDLPITQSTEYDLNVRTQPTTQSSEVPVPTMSTFPQNVSLPPISDATSTFSASENGTLVTDVVLSGEDDDLDDILPLSGVEKQYNGDAEELNQGCETLMKDLGIAPDNIKKLCGNGFYGPIIDLKEKFKTAIDWYQDKLNELEDDEKKINTLIINPTVSPDIRKRAETALSTIQEQKMEIRESYLSLLPMNQTVSDAVDAMVELRRQLLVALQMLKQRLTNGGIYGDNLQSEDRGLIENSVLDAQLMTMVDNEEQPQATTIDRKTIIESVDQILANDDKNTLPSTSVPTAKTLPSITDNAEYNTDDEDDDEDSVDSEDEEEDENIVL